MSHSQSTEIKRPENLVRLKIDGAKTSVNTLWDQETARGVSLVCPFPALEVDIPVHFGAGGENTGAIHRIGVEDDPETGLPRLRLSIRTRETRPTVIAKTSESLIKAVRIDAVSDNETGEQAMPAAAAVGPMVKPSGGSWSDFLSEISTSAEEECGHEDSYSMNGSSDRENDTDPSWAVCGEMPFPEDIRERVLTRRRYKMLRHVAGAFVLGMLAASLYLFDRAGVVSFGKMKDRIATAVLGNESEGLAVTAKTLPADLIVPEVTPDQVSEVDVAETNPALPVEPAVTAAATVASYASGPNPLLDETAPAAPAQLATQEVGTPAAQAAQAENLTESGATEAAETEGDINLLLPTRWPVEYATAYRVREPNGVVVDVPGGLVKREGWLEDGKQNPQVRSIKSIQRESGARFIVYVNGELPRFITTPKPNGVSLRLYFDGDEMKTSAVASLNK